MAEGVGSYEEIVTLLEGEWKICEETCQRVAKSRKVEPELAEYLFASKHLFTADFRFLEQFLTEDAKDRLAIKKPSNLMIFASLSKEQSIVCAEHINGSISTMHTVYPESQLILLRRGFLSQNHQNLTDEVIRTIITEYIDEDVWNIIFLDRVVSWFERLDFTLEQKSEAILRSIFGRYSAQLVKKNPKTTSIL